MPKTSPEERGEWRREATDRRSPDYIFSDDPDAVIRLLDDLEEAYDALEAFAGLRADDGDTFQSYPLDMIVHCEVTVREILAARNVLPNYPNVLLPE